MFKIAKIENNEIVKCPVNLDEEFPQTCFPATIEQKHLPEKYFIVENTEKPEYEFDEFLEETVGCVEGKAKVVWVKHKLDEYDFIKKVSEFEKKLNKDATFYADSVVNKRGYDSVVSACSYLNSSDPVYVSEAQACMIWRDLYWKSLYSILNDMKDKKRPFATFTQIVNELPVLTWPE